MFHNSSVVTVIIINLTNYNNNIIISMGSKPYDKSHTSGDATLSFIVYIII